MSIFLAFYVHNNLFTRMPDNSYRERFGSVSVTSVECYWLIHLLLNCLYSLAFIAYCRRFYRPNFYLRSSFSLIYLNPLSAFPAAKYRGRKNWHPLCRAPRPIKGFLFFTDDVSYLRCISYTLYLLACQACVSVRDWGLCFLSIFTGSN